MKVAVLLFAIAFIPAYIFAGLFWTLSYDTGFINPNSLLNTNMAAVFYFNGDIGYRLDSGFSISFKYDHITMDDYNYNGENARLVAVIPSLGIGYSFRFLDNKFMLNAGVNPGYAVSVRYRRGVTDYKSNNFAVSTTLGLYYNVVSLFYVGVEGGYRYLPVQFETIGGSIDLSGPYIGLSIKHLY